jgi:hypothetical protein
MDLLEEYVEINRAADKSRQAKVRRHMNFPAAVWCELSPAYDAHYRERVSKLGSDHPVIRTQYLLEPVESMGAYLSDAQRSALFSGDHPRLSGPREGMLYAMVVDIGGESESAHSDAEAMEESPGRDYTMAWVIEVDPTGSTEPYPEARIVDGCWWVGREHMSVAPDLVAMAQHWGVSGGVIDARGVGEAVAMAVHREIPCVEAYQASAADVSVDCYDLLARVNTGRVKFWRADPAADHERREVELQARKTRYEIRAHDKMKLAKPTGRGSVGLHIDGIKALTYLHRALAMPHAGLMAWARDQGVNIIDGKGTAIP